MFCFCKILCLVDLRICVCLNRAKPWLKVSVKFNRYSIRSFQRALVGVNKNLHWVSMSKISVPPFQMRPELGAGRSYFLLLQRKLFIRSSLFFQIHFGITYIWSIDHSFDLKIWFTVIFFLSKRVAFCSKYEFSLLNFHIFCLSFWYQGQNYQNVPQLFWWRTVTRPFVLVYQFYFYILHPIS